MWRKSKLLVNFGLLCFPGCTNRLCRVHSDDEKGRWRNWKDENHQKQSKLKSSWCFGSEWIGHGTRCIYQLKAFFYMFKQHAAMRKRKLQLSFFKAIFCSVGRILLFLVLMMIFYKSSFMFCRPKNKIYQPHMFDSNNSSIPWCWTAGSHNYDRSSNSSKLSECRC